MTSSEKTNLQTVLVLAPTFNDSKVAVDVLENVGLSARACKNVTELCANLNDECGAVIVSEEGIDISEIDEFLECLKQQPAWSDIPILLLTSNDVTQAFELFSKSGNISLLERPFSRLTLIRSVEVALRARRKQYEVRDLLQALNNAKDEAERANLSKTQFLANMSHEIRTPIGAILGFTDLMKNPANAPEENLNYMGIVERNSQQLLRLIDDILDLSKVEAGKMTIEQIEFSFAEMLTDFIAVMAFKAGEKGIGFQFDVESKVPDILYTDPVRLRQILTNTVGNALKFTDKGSVEFCVHYEEPCLKFVVKDTGVGISKEQQSRLFQPFAQADTSTTRKFGGTGLGLVLSRRLSENLGGKLELQESDPHFGSTFVIVINSPLLPHAKLVGKEALVYSATQPRTLNRSRALTGLKVLLVEDSPDNQILITTYLRKEGAKIKVASDGLQGVEAALSGNYDVLLMDIQMPLLDGYEATRSLREKGYAKPIIALTAHAMIEERNKCLEAGFDDFLTKPIRREHLVKALAGYTEL